MRAVVAIGLAAGVALAVAPAAADPLPDAVRTLLDLPASAQITWPPRTDLEAGSVVDPALRVLAKDAGDVRLSSISNAEAVIPLEPAQLQPLAGFWIWRAFLSDPNAVTVKLKLSELQLARWEPSDKSPLGSVRKANPQAIKRPQATRTVGRSWAARATVEISPVAAMTPAAWMVLRQTALADTTGTVALRANAITLALPESVTLAVDVGNWPEPLPHPGPVLAPKRWALATIASGRYQFLPGMDQDWNVRSAALVADALADWQPTLTKSLTPDTPQGLSRDGVLDFLDAFLKDAGKAKSELLVVYYVGHMERAGTGALSLLMGDAPAERKIRAVPPATGFGNLRDLMQVVDQAEAELAPRPGSLDVAVIHRKLSQAKIPFVLLVDGCLEDPQFAEARARLGIVVDARGGEPVYVGPGDAGSALREQIARLQAYPQDFTWLKSRDPTVLGATPGTAAYAERNPLWLFGASTGPVARRLYDVVTRTRWSDDRPSLIRILGFAADRQSIGPQELVGTVSWSDWMPYLRKFDPASFKR